MGFRGFSSRVHNRATRTTDGTRPLSSNLCALVTRSLYLEGERVELFCWRVTAGCSKLLERFEVRISARRFKGGRLLHSVLLCIACMVMVCMTLELYPSMKPLFLLFLTTLSSSASPACGYLTSYSSSSIGVRVIRTTPTHGLRGPYVGWTATSTRRRSFSPPNLQYKSTPEDTSSVEDSDWDARAPPSAVDLPPGAPSDAEVEATTMEWMKRTVIGLNLCPFAERPIKTKELSLHVVRGDDPQTISEAVAVQLRRKRDEKGTAIVIAPEFCVDDFEEYMAMVQFLEERVMTYYDLHGHVQIAAFHPDFTFDGSGDSIDCYTNRSPYPAFHVLREDEVGRAVKKLGGDPGRVWRRNKRLLEILEEKLGRLRVVKLLLGKGRLDGKQKEDEDDSMTTDVLVEEALEQTKLDMEKEEKEGGERNIIRGVWVR